MLIEFKNHKVEVIYINDKPYFKAKDVCEVLGFKNPRDALNSHCDKKGVVSADVLTTTGIKKANFINEPNLYSLIFNVPKIFSSDTEEQKLNKQKADEFKWFVFEKIIPQIRKTGSFSLTDIQSLSKHTKRDQQIENSKIVNALNFALGGKEKIIEYNRENCKVVTGKTTKQIKALGKQLGLKSKVYNSAKEVLRNVPEFQANACTMSFNDEIIANNPEKKLKDLKTLDEKVNDVFQEMLNMGIKPAELNRN